MELKSTSFAVSVSAHVLALTWGLINFSAPKPLESEPVDSILVDVIAMSDQSLAKAGQKNAKAQENPKPKAEKTAPETKNVFENEDKISEKQEITTASTAAPPPPPPPPEPVTQKPVETPLPPTPTPAPEVEAEAPKPQRKPEPPKEEVKPQPLQTTQQQPEKKFDADKIAALLDQRAPQRQSATASEINNQATLGTKTGTSARLAQSELDALRARIQQCWNPPVGASNAQDIVVRIRFALNRDGTLASSPALTNRGSSPYFQAAAESALRAIRRCEPYTVLPAAKYESWKDIEITFDPRDMFRS